MCQQLLQVEAAGSSGLSETEVSLIILPPAVFSAVTRYDQLLAAVWLKDAPVHAHFL